MKVAGIYIQDSETSQYNRVDLFDDEKISVTSSIQNINDIAKTYTDFSQTFTVPASKQNNKIFRHWYDNSNDYPFSTLTKSNAYIEIDTIPFRKGKIQLESANVVDGQPQDYSITFIGILGNLKDTFAGKYLKDLTSTAYDFNYTADEVLSKVTGDGASEDVMFPLISSKRLWGYGDGNGVTNNIANEDYPIRYNELFPAIRLRAVLNMIETEFGINFDGIVDEPSTFLSDARFTNAYLYLKNAETFEVKRELTKINFTSESGDSSSFTGYTVDLINDRITNTTADSNIIFAGFNRKKLTFNITPSVSGITYKVLINKNGILFFDSGLLGSTSGVTYSKEIENTTNRFGTNDYFEIYVGTDGAFTFTTNTVALSTYVGPSSTITKTRNFISASQTTPSYTLQINQYFPEIKIEDFFSGLLKMFNLTCYSTDGLNYTVEQLESYYSDGSDVDITKYVLQDKKALNRVKTYKKINFEYEKSESFINVAFESNAGIPYGTLRYVNNPITEGEEYSVKLPFEDLNFSNLNALLQVGYSLKTDYLNYIPKPIILYDYNSANATTAPEFYWSNLLDATGVAFTKYKAFGQETLISGETYSLNFNEQQSTLTNEIVSNSLYQNYYSDYFKNIYNYKARLIKISAILPTSVLTTLKLNDSIIIRDAKYLINSYTTDLTTGLVQFELLTDERVKPDKSLVLNLDAGNPLSYPGTGTLWTDLSGNNNNGTLVNGPTFDPANGGSIVFDGLNDYVNFGTSNNINIRNATTLSLSAVVNCTGFSNPQTNYSWSPIMVIDKYNSGISYRKFNFYYYLENEIQTVQCDFFDGFGNSKSVFYNTTVLNTKIHIFVTVNSNNTVLYINGVSVNQNTGIIVNPNPQNSDFTIGSRINTNYNGYFKGNIYNAKIYNRAISASEVLQNYNSIKELYGI